MQKYGKLVRDRIPEIIKKNGENPVTRILDDEEYRNELLKKLREETEEAIEAAHDKKEFIKELGDVREILNVVYKEFGVDSGDVEKISQERLEKRGGFEKKIFLESVE